jgi:hypothetical protein
METEYKKLKRLFDAIGKDSLLWKKLSSCSFKVKSSYIEILDNSKKIVKKIYLTVLERIGCDVYEIVDSLKSSGAILIPYSPTERDTITTVPHLKSV